MIGAGIPHEQVLVDGRPAPDLSPGATVIVPYADNLNVIGVCKGDVQRVKDAAASRLRQVGFRVHEEEDASTYARALGLYHWRKEGEDSSSARKTGQGHLSSPAAGKTSKGIRTGHWTHHRALRPFFHVEAGVRVDFLICVQLQRCLLSQAVQAMDDCSARMWVGSQPISDLRSWSVKTMESYCHCFRRLFKWHSNMQLEGRRLHSSWN